MFLYVLLIMHISFTSSNSSCSLPLSDSKGLHQQMQDFSLNQVHYPLPRFLSLQYLLNLFGLTDTSYNSLSCTAVKPVYQWYL